MGDIRSKDCQTSPILCVCVGGGGGGCVRARVCVCVFVIKELIVPTQPGSLL